MKDRELLQGRITSVEHHENEGSKTRWDSFTYEFEYNGIHFEDNSKALQGVLSDDDLKEGMPVDVWFYPDTQEWKIKYRRIIVGDRDEEGNKVTTPKLMYLAVGIVFLGFCIGIVLSNVKIIISTMGIGFAMFGIGTIAKEIKFFIDKSNGKYKVLNALVVDFKRSRVRRSNGHRYVYKDVYKNVYEYIEDGEAKHYVSPGGDKRRQIGDEIFIYKNISTGEIKKGTEWKEGIVVFVLFVAVGVLLIRLSLVL